MTRPSEMLGCSRLPQLACAFNDSCNNAVRDFEGRDFGRQTFRGLATRGDAWRLRDREDDTQQSVPHRGGAAESDGCRVERYRSGREQWQFAPRR
jgi:hypothetical protein